MPNIVIPDDYPIVMGSSPSFLKLRDSMSCVCFDTLPESEEALVSRIGAAGVVINIRASTKFPASVFAACPDLKLLSIWGTGTDNVDLEAARRHGVGGDEYAWGVCAFDRRALADAGARRGETRG
jgi:hypothetical protein